MFIDESVITVISGKGGDGAATLGVRNLFSLEGLMAEMAEKVEILSLLPIQILIRLLTLRAVKSLRHRMGQKALRHVLLENLEKI